MTAPRSRYPHWRGNPGIGRSSTIRVMLGCVALALNLVGWTLGQTWAIWASLGAAATLVIITLAEYIITHGGPTRRR